MNSIGILSIFLSLLFPPSSNSRGEDSLPLVVASAQEESGERLMAVPLADRGAEWHYLAALVALTRGEEQAADDLAGLASRAGSPRGWFLREFLAVHSQKGKWKGELPPSAWRGVPSVVTSGALLDWASRRLEAPAADFPSIHQVLLFGGWPESQTRGKNFMRPEPQGRGERLLWLNQSRSVLLRRLTGAPLRRPLSGPPPDGRWVLVTLLRSGDTLPARLRECERLWTLLEPERLLFLWILELDHGERAERLTRFIGDPTFPLIVASTRGEDSFAVPGFETGGVHLLIDGQMILRQVWNSVIPLPVMKDRIAAVMGKK